MFRTLCGCKVERKNAVCPPVGRCRRTRGKRSLWGKTSCDTTYRGDCATDRCCTQRNFSSSALDCSLKTARVFIRDTERRGMNWSFTIDPVLFFSCSPVPENSIRRSERSAGLHSVEFRQKTNDTLDTGHFHRFSQKNYRKFVSNASFRIRYIYNKLIDRYRIETLLYRLK